LSERLAFDGGDVEGKRESGVGKGQTAGGRVKDHVQRRAKAAGKQSLHQTLVQKRNNRVGVGVGFVNASERTHDQGAIQGCRQSLSYHVAEVEADHPVGQAKEIDKVAAHLKERSETESDLDRIVTEWPGGDERGLDEASFAHVILANPNSASGLRVWA
jgi:hypothetical protein